MSLSKLCHRNFSRWKLVIKMYLPSGMYFLVMAKQGNLPPRILFMKIHDIRSWNWTALCYQLEFFRQSNNLITRSVKFRFFTIVLLYAVYNYRHNLHLMNELSQSQNWSSNRLVALNTRPLACYGNIFRDRKWRRFISWDRGILQGTVEHRNETGIMSGKDARKRHTSNNQNHFLGTMLQPV